MMSSGVIAMMSVSIVGILIVAALFFVVTMALAVGPLLLCRIFASPGRDECRPQPRRSSLASGVLTFCGVVIGLAVGLFVLRFALTSSPQRSTDVVVHADTGIAVSPPFAPDVPPGAPHFAEVPAEHVSPVPMEIVEHSLFAPPRPPAPPRPFVSRADVLEIGSIVLMLLLLVAVVVAVTSERARAVLVRMVPVFLAASLLGILFFWSFDTVSPPQVVEHSGINTYPPHMMEPPDSAPPPDRWKPLAVSPPERRQLTTAAELQGMTTGQSSQAAVTEAVEVTPAEAAAATQDGSAEDSEQTEDPPVLAYVGTAAAGVPHDALPQWTSQADDRGPIRVIDSGLHATVKLAEEHALEKLKTLLQSELVQRYPQAAGWQPPDQVVLNADNILQRAVERSQIQVGDNTIPMYEAYWQVDLSRLEPLYRVWRPSVVQQRLIWTAGGVGLLTLLLGSIAGVLRVDEQTHGRRRKSLAAGTLVLWALVGGLALFVA